MGKLTVHDLREARRILTEQDFVEPDTQCMSVVAVLGDTETYPCLLEEGHEGKCQPDLSWRINAEGPGEI